MTSKLINGLTVQEAGKRTCPKTFEPCIANNCMAWHWVKSTARPRGYCAQNVDIVSLLNALPHGCSGATEQKLTSS